MTRPCPVCSSDRRDLLYTVPTGQTIHCCDDCGMVYADNTPVVDYTQNSTYASAATYPSSPTYYSRIVQNCIEAGATRNKSVLDVGCALGGLMQAFLAEEFQTVHGLSISPEEVAACQSRGLTAFERDVADIASTTPYDLVTLSHVLEHILEPVPFLRALRRWVKPSGALYVEVPNALYYADYFTGICQGFNGEHINHFDIPHLCDALECAGFNINFTGDYMRDAGSPYPCAYVIATPKQWGTTLRDAVERYTDRLDVQMAQVTTRIQDQLNGWDTPVAIWGAGQTAHMLLAGPLKNLGVIDATDTNPAYHGTKIEGCLVEAPECFRPPQKVPIVVCSQLSQKAIVAQIRTMGLTNHIITLESE